MQPILPVQGDSSQAPAPDDCRMCSHPVTHHDAGECWTTASGAETWDDPPDKCDCWWYEPVKARLTILLRGGRWFAACSQHGGTFAVSWDAAMALMQAHMIEAHPETRPGDAG